jgi:RNA polymerase sigma factor (sigma-70 family)
VRSIARRLRGRAPQLETDELVSVGTIGLIEALDRFDDRVGVRFATFAYRRIEGAILDEIRRLARVPSTPDAARVPPVSLAGGTDGGPTIQEATPDPFAPDPEAYAEVVDLVEAVDALPPTERTMMHLAASGHTGAEIARRYGCSEARISQILGRARTRLEARTAG